jgi:hypothetical protein
MARLQKLAAEDGSYAVLVDDKPLRTSLSSEEADEMMAELAYLEPLDEEFD